ncbi:MAG: 16S rRNA (guanine(527)-N(7))-methyltransferase RsmG [Magnetospirillum sp. WYHS-4]
MSPEEFLRTIPDAGPNLNRLRTYADLLVKWQKRINLVGASTLDDLWRRHMLDSAQLLSYLPPTTQAILDIGSGAGFPGLVLAILGPAMVHLVDSDTRKCAFLREAIRLTGAKATVHHGRIETLGLPGPIDVVTARALAPLSILLQYGQPFLRPTTICLFLKGRSVQDELTESRKTWNMTANQYPSLTDASGVILSLERISRHHGIADC